MGRRQYLHQDHPTRPSAGATPGRCSSRAVAQTSRPLGHRTSWACVWTTLSPCSSWTPCPTRRWCPTWSTALSTLGPTGASIETLLHSFIPATVVAHSHADRGNRPHQTHLRPTMSCGTSTAKASPLPPTSGPGFRLSKMVGELVREHPAIKGVVLANHGLFTWGDTAKTAYDNHIDLVSQAEDYARRHAAGKASLWHRQPRQHRTRRHATASPPP